MPPPSLPSGATPTPASVKARTLFLPANEVLTANQYSPTDYVIVDGNGNFFARTTNSYDAMRIERLPEVENALRWALNMVANLSNTEHSEHFAQAMGLLPK